MELGLKNLNSKLSGICYRSWTKDFPLKVEIHIINILPIATWNINGTYKTIYLLINGTWPQEFKLKDYQVEHQNT